MRVLVTGATGFIGSHIVRELRSGGHEVRAVVRASSRLKRLEDVRHDVDWITCDLESASTAQLRAVADSLDGCVHAAWYVEPGRYAESPRNVTWVKISLRLLEALGQAGCSRAVFLGTCFEYDHRAGYLVEGGATRPWTLYGAAKLSTWLLGEHLAWQAGVRLSWARIFYQYGPFEHKGRLVPSVIRSLLAGDHAEVTRGRQIRDFLHVADVGSALVAVLESDHAGTVNIGSGKPVEVREVVGCIAKALDARERVRFGTRPESPSDPPFICANTRVLSEEIGWSPHYDLETGIGETVKWWKRRLAGTAATQSANARGKG